MLYDYESQQQKKQSLEAARREQAREDLKKYSTGKNQGMAKNTINQAKNIAKTATPIGLLGLLLSANIISDWTYGLALMAAILKDILDLIEFTGIGYVIVLVVTFCISIFIGFMMILGSILDSSGSNNSRIQRKIIRSWLILIGGTGAELIFGLNVLPIETLTVLLVYALALYARKAARAS